jgi:hypothetical protein
MCRNLHIVYGFNNNVESPALLFLRQRIEEPTSRSSDRVLDVCRISVREKREEATGRLVHKDSTGNTKGQDDASQLSCIG